MSKTKTNIAQALIFISLLGLIILGSSHSQPKQPSQIAEASFEDLRADKQKEIEKLDEDKKKLETKTQINDLEKQQADLELKKLTLQEGLKAKGQEPTINTLAGVIATLAPTITLEAQKTPVITASKIPERKFRLNSGKFITGQKILDMVKGNPNGLKLWQAFNHKFGTEIADTAAISLYYENGTMKVDSIGVCNRKYMIKGDYRNCTYADMNSAGMDVGLKQINTFYQRKRIAKLSGINCKIGNSRDRKDPCTAQLITWLINPDNNILIAIDIYQEQGFTPWYGWKRAFRK
jgi:hypothetical protein